MNSPAQETRGKTSPRGVFVGYHGFAHVLGAASRCWCGETTGHDWPGKDKKKPHPRGNS